MNKRAGEELNALKIFATVASSGGFREAARLLHASPSGLSDAVRRLESRLGVRLLNRTTRSISPTEQGQRLLEHALPALEELDNALQAAAVSADRPVGTLRLNVPVNVARLILPDILPRFLQAYPEINVEIVGQSGLVDILAAGCDAGIRYDEGLEQDMIATRIGPREQRFATAASPDYLNRHGRPEHPDELLKLDCLAGRFSKGNIELWEYQRGEEYCRIEPRGPLIYSAGGAADLGVAAAISGLGVIYLFEEWLRPHLDSGALEPILEPWWLPFPGPYLYYPGRKLVPPALRAFIDFIKVDSQ
ncbi:LysR family transcriptional regulator [Kluyvera sp. NPDC087067]|uniref:LysR family transcriptional regulator n=1 Tax=Kluyvera sp. NPDC087067 TaxID=3364105 RepID=UPI00382B74DF